MEETQYLMTKWIYKPKVHHISCILKKALLAKVFTAWGNLDQKPESISFWSNQILWYLASFPTFEEQKKESRQWTEITKMPRTTAILNSLVQLCEEGFF